MKPPSEIRADLSNGVASAKGHATGGNAPILNLCRLLIADNEDPRSPMMVWRGATIALKIRSIGEGARLGVREGDETIRLCRYSPYEKEPHVDRSLHPLSASG
jgi:hypothetical protein